MDKAKLKIYLETSIVSAYFDFWGKSPEQKRITRKFWNKAGKDYKFYTSDITIAELMASEEKMRSMFFGLIRNVERLKTNKKTKDLAEKYIRSGIVPNSKLADANHLAVATIYRMDFLVSWNSQHITRPLKRRQITEFNEKNHLPIPIILTPVDFLDIN